MSNKIEDNLPSPPHDLRQLRTRRALREGLLTLIRTRPFEEITVRDIAKESLVGYNTFFRHYASKTELMEEVVQNEIEQLFVRALPAIIGEDSYTTAVAICEYVDQHRELWTALLVGGIEQPGDGAAPVLRRMFVAYALKQDVRIPEHEWLPVDLGATFGVGAVLDILGWWLAKPGEYSIEQIAELLDRLVLTPTLGAVLIGANKKRK